MRRETRSPRRSCACSVAGCVRRSYSLVLATRTRTRTYQVCEGGRQGFALRQSKNVNLPGAITSLIKGTSGAPGTRRGRPPALWGNAKACESSLHGRALGRAQSACERRSISALYILCNRPGLGFFSIQEKVNFNTRYHHISLYINVVSLCIMLYLVRDHHIYHVPRRHMISMISMIYNA